MAGAMNQGPEPTKVEHQGITNISNMLNKNSYRLPKTIRTQSVISVLKYLLNMPDLLGSDY